MNHYWGFLSKSSSSAWRLWCLAFISLFIVIPVSSAQPAHTAAQQSGSVIVLGSYGQREGANRSVKNLQSQLVVKAWVLEAVSQNKHYHRVVVGPFFNGQEKLDQQSRLKQLGHQGSWSLAVNPSMLVKQWQRDREAKDAFRYLGHYTGATESGIQQAPTGLQSRISNIQIKFNSNQEFEAEFLLLESDSQAVKKQQLWRRSNAGRWAINSEQTLAAPAGEIKPAIASVQVEPAVKPSQVTVTPSVVASSKAKAARKTRSAIPAGFESLFDPQTTGVDIYYAGRFVTTQVATFTPDEITLSAPQKLIQKIPNILNKEKLGRALTGPLATNAAFVCISDKQKKCGSLSPEVADIIFDEGRFRLDLFIGSTQLSLQQVNLDKFLPASDTGFSFLQNMNVAFSGLAGGDSSYNLNGFSSLSFRENRLLINSNFSQDDAFAIDSITVERSLNGRAYQAGIFNGDNQGLSFLPRSEMYGFRMASSLETRNDLRLREGNELSVFLTARSRVEILKDDRLLSTRIYNSGNQVLDTSSLPSGAYDVQLRIIEGGNVSEETRFYVKTNQLPPADQPLYFIEAGKLTDDSGDDVLPEATDDWLLRLGYARRLSDSFGGNVGFASSQDDSLLEFGLFQLGRSYELQATVSASAQGQYGFVSTARWRLGDLTVSGSYRQVFADAVLPAENVSTQRLFLNQASSQSSINFNYPIGADRISFSTRYNKRVGQDVDTEYSLRYQLAPLKWWGSNININMEVNKRNQELQAALTLQMRFDQSSGWQNNFTQRIDWQQNDLSEQNTTASTNLSSQWQDGDLFASDVALALNSNHDDAQDSFGADLDYYSRLGRGNFALDFTKNNDVSTRAYSGNFASSFFTNGSVSAFGGQQSAQSAVVIDLKGAATDAYFEVMVNNSSRGYATIGDKTIINLQPFETYNVQIVDRGTSFVEYDQSARQTTLYPGNVKNLTWEVAQVVVIFGRVLDAKQQPIKNALITGVSGLGLTDDYGIFQAELIEGAQKLQIKTREAECEVVLPKFQAKNSIAALGDLICL